MLRYKNQRMRTPNLVIAVGGQGPEGKSHVFCFVFPVCYFQLLLCFDLIIWSGQKRENIYIFLKCFTNISLQ